MGKGKKTVWIRMDGMGSSKLLPPISTHGDGPGRINGL